MTGAGAGLDGPGLATGQRGLGAVVRVRPPGQAGQHGGGQRGVEAGVTAPHIRLRVARDGAHVAENRKYCVKMIVFTSFSSDNCLSAIPE